MIPCPISPNCPEFDTQIKLAFHLQTHEINDLVLEVMYLLDVLHNRIESK